VFCAVFTRERVLLILIAPKFTRIPKSDTCCHVSTCACAVESRYARTRHAHRRTLTNILPIVYSVARFTLPSHARHSICPGVCGRVCCVVSVHALFSNLHVIIVRTYTFLIIFNYVCSDVAQYVFVTFIRVVIEFVRAKLMKFVCILLFIHAYTDRLFGTSARRPHLCAC
jgi:hypothetical protein